MLKALYHIKKRTSKSCRRFPASRRHAEDHDRSCPETNLQRPNLKTSKVRCRRFLDPESVPKCPVGFQKRQGRTWKSSRASRRHAEDIEFAKFAFGELVESSPYISRFNRGHFKCLCLFWSTR